MNPCYTDLSASDTTRSGSSKQGAVVIFDWAPNLELYVPALVEPHFKSGGAPGPATNPTHIIFDWDDILMCSWALSTGKSMDPVELWQLERAIKSVLDIASRLGEVSIVTNASASWVWDSMCSNLPGLLSTLSCLQVISARDRYEQSHPGDPVTWKQFAFADVIAGGHTHSIPRGTSLVLLGASMTEFNAAQKLGRNLYVKTVAFKERPSVTDLIKQLSRVERDLGPIVDRQDDVEITLVRSTRHSQSSSASSSSSVGSVRCAPSSSSSTASSEGQNRRAQWT